MVSDFFTDIEYDHVWEWAAYNNLYVWKEKVEKLLEKHYIILPLFVYEHGGITMNTSGFSCPWDSGQVGFIYVSVAEAKKEYGWNRLTSKRRKQIESYLRQEVETYDKYLTGDVWGYVIYEEEDDPIESCWGFYGYDECEREAIEMLKWAEKESA